MTNIQIFEPGLCCGTGICGVDVDQQLITFSADMDWVRTEGGDVTRFNLAQEPLAFAENDTARTFLKTAGEESLPVVLVDGATVLTGRYPTRAELGRWAALDSAPLAEVMPPTPAAVQPEGSRQLLPMAAATQQGDSSCCGGTCCG
ncbi:arsenite efflux transporter metallochaperone ArsD [Cryobacterium psychrophilum]|uniref:Arsenite efflux transporter metallochaperone ArsD n=2 Tax=Cryobacterium psychrophilum TaxID=41988 RepID=A0A4Y8KL34_9MICO|nr:arsenite efflux transporter metallochaperone ArsD [Cryobacterium psychrophilum]